MRPRQKAQHPRKGATAAATAMGTVGCRKQDTYGGGIQSAPMARRPGRPLFVPAPRPHRSKNGPQILSIGTNSKYERTTATVIDTAMAHHKKEPNAT